ncbi:MAG: type II secretion system F family protein [Planctomycetaceae bacterium]|nr:type II secretion system F family protein [Planctomycetaceae bacterium]
MNSGHLQTMMFVLNRPEPIRQSSLLMVLSAGMGDPESMTAGLKALAAECSPPWKDRVEQLRVLLELGNTLSSALTTVREVLPEETLAAIRVAEECGTLKQVLADEAQRLVRQTSARNPMSPDFTMMLMLVAALSSIALSIVSFMMVFIVPKLKHIYDDFGAELPSTTTSFINASDWLAKYWFMTVFPVMCLMGYGIKRLVSAEIRSLSTGRSLVSAWQPRSETPMTLRLLSITVAAGHSLPETFHSILRELTPGRVTRRLSAVRAMVTAGGDCWESLRSEGFLRRREVAFLRAAERTGHLDWGLMHLSRAIQTHQEAVGDRIVHVATWGLLLIFALITGFICVAMFSPLVNLTMEQATVGCVIRQTISGGG